VSTEHNIIITIAPDINPGPLENGVVVNIQHPTGGVLAYTGKALHMEIEEYDPTTPEAG
jgi:hypothetical protein